MLPVPDGTHCVGLHNVVNMKAIFALNQLHHIMAKSYCGKSIQGQLYSLAF